jgi:hypothetical protein
MVFIDRNESERLQTVGDRGQHLGCAKHCPRVCQKHQLDARALIQRARQAQQSAADGNDLQRAADAASVLEAKNSRSRVRKLQSRRSPLDLGLQALSRLNPIMFPGRETWDVTEGPARRIAVTGAFYTGGQWLIVTGVPSRANLDLVRRL